MTLSKYLVVLGALTFVSVAVVGWAEQRNAVQAAPAHASSRPHRSTGGEPSPIRTANHAAAKSLGWRIVSSHTSRRIENEYLPSTARGIYVIMEVVADNRTGHAVLLDSDQVELDLGGTVYPLDTGALAALQLAGRRTLSATELRPAATISGWVVFDVPPKAAAAAPGKLCLEQRALAAAASPC